MNFDSQVNRDKASVSTGVNELKNKEVLVKVIIEIGEM